MKITAKCPRCGRPLTGEDLYCPGCGRKNDQLIKSGVLAFVEANKRALAVVLCLAVVFGGVMTVRAVRAHKRAAAWQAYKAYQSTSSSGSGYSSSSSGSGFPSLHKYENSTYKIGTDMPAGEYVFFANSSVSGYFCLSSDSAGDSIIQNDNFSYDSIMTVEDGEYLELSRCYATPISSVTSLDTSGEGMFKVGVHLKAGEYKLEATGSSGYYCVYDDDRQDDIASNDNFTGTTYVTVRSGQYLELSRCRIVG